MPEIFSMTGFGRKVGEYDQKKISVEIRSLNSKVLDYSIRIPAIYREKEIEIRNLILDKLIRGKIELLITVELVDEEQITIINKNVFLAHYRQLSNIYHQINQPVDNFAIANILRFPDIFETKNEKLLPEEWIIVKQIIEECLEECVVFRRNEGKALYNDITANIKSISNLRTEIEPHEQSRRFTVKERLTRILEETVGFENIDKNRLEQELIYYIEKLDINEEMVRLEQHIKYFIDTISTEHIVGRKLIFITQEIGREINTLGAKANHSEIQKIIVMMKDELEKIKEQIQNIL